MIRKLNSHKGGLDTGGVPSIKDVPADRALRERIREKARLAIAPLSRARPLKRGQLEELADKLLAGIHQPRKYLGHTMVALSNEFWMPQFVSTPFDRRLLLLPHCLRRLDICSGKYDAIGLQCARCGSCPIADLVGEAETLGYRVVVAEGTPAVLQLILTGNIDAIFGVACLDSLEKAFERIVDLGIPHVGSPLLTDGCADTAAELDNVVSIMRLHASRNEERTRSYVPLLRAAERLFEPGIIDSLLTGEFQSRPGGASDPSSDPITGTEAIAYDWLRAGGKRFRPFITLAGYAAMTLGESALHPDADLTDAFPVVVQQASLAIEAIHKASLVHDDLEDDDAFRYGVETLHRRYGVATAVNVGDYLLGLGYRLIAAGADELGPHRTSRMLSVLSRSHLRLARGQGAELLWSDRSPADMRPIDLLTIYALKTAPAFEAALMTGLLAAGSIPDCADRLSAYCRYLGVAYQVLNDLKDWHNDGDKVVAGQDMLSARPTLLLTFAFEAATGDRQAELIALLDSTEPANVRFAQLRRVYESLGVFDKAEALVDKYRSRAFAAATGMDPPALRELLHFIVDVVLH